MEFGILQIIFIALFLTQLALGIIAVVAQRGLHNRFAHALGSNVSTVDLLQRYSRVYTTLNIKVDAGISRPAYGTVETLLVNRRQVYSTSLYNNFFTIFQILLSQPAYRMVYRGRRLEQLVLAVEAVLFVASLYLWQPIVIVAVILAIVLILISFVYQSYLGDVLDDAYEVAVDMLDLDDVEKSRARHLMRELKTEAFAYAWDPLRWVVHFFSPFTR